MLDIKLDRVTKTPLALETLALSEAVDGSILAVAMIEEVFQLLGLPYVFARLIMHHLSSH